MKQVYWCGEVPAQDDFGYPITDRFIDGRTRMGGVWALMSPQAFRLHGMGIDIGLGQLYKKQPDGRWLKQG